MVRTDCVFLTKVTYRNRAKGCTWHSPDPRLLYVTGGPSANSWQAQLARQVRLTWHNLIPKASRLKKIIIKERLQDYVKAAAKGHFSLELESSPLHSEL